MSIKTKAASVALALAVVAASAGSVFAYEARTTGTVNVRSGPATHYYAVDKLRAGKRVEVDHCKRGWCYVDYRGGEGWVSKKFLFAGRYYENEQGGGYYDDVEYPDDDYGFGQDIGNGGGIEFELNY